MSNIEYSRSVRRGGAATTNSAATTGKMASQRRSLSNSNRPTATQAPTQAFLVSVKVRGNEQGRQHQCRPGAVALVEEKPRRRVRDDEHQHSRVGHGLTHGPARLLSQGVEFEDAVLHDSVHGDDGAYRHDDVRCGPRTGSARPPVGYRDDDEQDELLRVDEAGERVERKDDGDQCDAGVRATSGQNIAGASGRSCRTIITATHSRRVRVNRICVTAIES